jgi:hypothetical protein
MTSPDESEPQAAVRAARRRLLGGRGKGASEAEVDALTRERPRYAGEPVSEQLEALHERTAVARGDTAAMQRDIDRTRDRLATGVEAVASRIDPRRHRPAAGPVVLALAVSLLLVFRWRRRR